MTYEIEIVNDQLIFFTKDNMTEELYWKTILKKVDLAELEEMIAKYKQSKNEENDDN